MTGTALTTTATVAPYRPCALPYHQPGSRVGWQSWCRMSNDLVWTRGTVLAHVDRTVVVDVDGVRIVTSCGPVVEVS